jgi:hypothetical protein
MVFVVKQDLMDTATPRHGQFLYQQLRMDERNDEYRKSKKPLREDCVDFNTQTS